MEVVSGDCVCLGVCNYKNLKNTIYNSFLAYSDLSRYFLSNSQNCILLEEDRKLSQLNEEFKINVLQEKPKWHQRPLNRWLKTSDKSSSSSYTNTRRSKGIYSLRFENASTEETFLSFCDKR